MSANSAAAVRGAGGKSVQEEEPTSPEKKPDGGGDVIPWGEDNLFPQAVIKDVEKNTILPSLLEKKTSMMYGGGIVYGIVTGVNKDGSKIFEAQEVPEIEEFMDAANVGLYAMEALLDINYFANAFPELVVSKNRQKIVGISTQEAPWTRYLKPTKGLPTHVVINANWDNGGTATDAYATQVPILDPYYDAVGSLRARTDGFKFIYPISIPSPDKAYYQLASWNAVRRSGWLDVMAAIPEFKKSLFKNQLSVKYLVTIHSAYWEWKYGDWEGLSQDEKVRLINEELTNFDNVMAGTNGAGKTVMSTTILDKRDGKEVEAFKIEAIDDKLKDGLYIEDSGEASSHVYTAVGVPGALMGVSPGKSMGDGAGGGSEPRVLFNNFISTAQFHLDLVLAPLNLIARYNNWTVNGKPVKFRFLNPFVMQAEAKNTPAADPKQQSK
ncbi:hypothetical protein Q5H93_14740 [Hymenobacter sp. ASUV-10]|uniref:Uncharacterized protein n=1 Tax=Hymenobacter aranciens TaxID=3063996 RepID=A0ABT9BHK3_9BACT|nr:hypothetical protein [Hymenobacter sp. ASUV-10]